VYGLLLFFIDMLPRLMDGFIFPFSCLAKEPLEQTNDPFPKKVQDRNVGASVIVIILIDGRTTDRVVLCEWRQRCRGRDDHETGGPCWGTDKRPRQGKATNEIGRACSAVNHLDQLGAACKESCRVRHEENTCCQLWKSHDGAPFLAYRQARSRSR
jgi:hypothetical protein